MISARSWARFSWIEVISGPTEIRVSGRARRAQRIACRVWRTASLVMRYSHLANETLLSAVEAGAAKMNGLTV